jgi:hypothetical protein
MTETMEDRLQMPPFQNLKWEDYHWTGSIVLPTWAGFRMPKHVGDVYKDKESDGTAKLVVETADKERTPPTAEQAAAFQHLLDNEAAVTGAILQAIYSYYIEEQLAYGYEEDEKEEFMPDIEQPNQLKQLIGLYRIHVLSDGKDHVPYIGFELGCTWDPEHDLGVMTHAGQVLVVQDGEAAFTPWIAETYGKH